MIIGLLPELDPQSTNAVSYVDCSIRISSSSVPKWGKFDYALKIGRLGVEIAVVCQNNANRFRFKYQDSYHDASYDTQLAPR